MTNCSNCLSSSYGGRDSDSDFCDACTHDPDTGLGGFTDHSINMHFNSEAEAEAYYNSHRYEDDKDDKDDEDDEDDDYDDLLHSIKLEWDRMH